MQSVILCGSVVLQTKLLFLPPFAMSEYDKSHFLLEFTNRTLLLTLFQRRGGGKRF